MKKTIVYISFILLALQIPAFAEDIYSNKSNEKSDILLKGELGIWNKRTFRGQVLSDEISLQPMFSTALRTKEAGDLGFSLFSHISASSKSSPNPSYDDFKPESDPDIKSFDEFDPRFFWQKDFDIVTLDLGHRWYFYSENNSRLQDSAEFYGVADVDVITHPYLLTAYDYDAYKGWYLESGIRQPVPLGLGNENNLIIPFAKIGLGYGLSDGKYPIYEDNGITFYQTGIETEFPLTKNLFLKPGLNYIGKVDGNTNCEVSFGINLAGNFSM